MPPETWQQKREHGNALVEYVKQAMKTAETAEQSIQLQAQLEDAQQLLREAADEHLAVEKARLAELLAYYERQQKVREEREARIAALEGSANGVSKRAQDSPVRKEGNPHYRDVDVQLDGAGDHSPDDLRSLLLNIARDVQELKKLSIEKTAPEVPDLER